MRHLQHEETKIYTYIHRGPGQQDYDKQEFSYYLQRKKKNAKLVDILKTTKEKKTLNALWWMRDCKNLLQFITKKEKSRLVVSSLVDKNREKIYTRGQT